MNILTFKPQIAWASGIDPSGDIITLKVDKENENQVISFIPPHFQMAGVNRDTGEILQVMLAADGGFVS